MDGRIRGLASEALRQVVCALVTAFAASALARHARAEDVAPPNVPRSARTTPPVVSEAVRPAVLPEDPSSFTSVIELEDYRGEGKSVEDLLADSVGVNVRRFGGPGRPAEISIRGSSASQVVILLDGVRLNNAQSGGVDVSTIPAELIERIEVSRGGGSVQVGSDAIGGVVNIITKRASGEPRTTLSGSGGSFSTWKGAATHTGRLGESEFLLGGDVFYTKGDWEFLEVENVTDGVVRPTSGETFTRINNETTNLSGLAKIGRDFGDRIHVSATDSLFYGSSGEPGPALLTGAFLGQSATAHRRRTRNVAKLEAVGADLTAWKLEGSLSVFHRYERSRFLDDMALFGTSVDSDNRNHSLGGRVEVARDAELRATQHRVSLGLELREDWLVAKTFDDQDRFVAGLFLQDEIGLAGGRLKLVPALRLDGSEGFGTEWLPRLGVVLELAPWLRLKGNVERSYRIPNFDELFIDETFLRGDPNLEPELAFNADVGIELGMERLGPLDDLYLEFALFRNDISESIVFQTLGRVTIATNTGDALAQGVELDWRFGMFGWVGVSGNATFLETEIGGGPPLPGRPGTEVSLRFEAGSGEHRVKLVYEAHYVGEFTIDTVGATTIASQLVYDASATLNLHRFTSVAARIPFERLSVFAKGRNLTDQAVRDSVGYPQPGRAFEFGVEAVF